jgi:hypothetical protein
MKTFKKILILAFLLISGISYSQNGEKGKQFRDEINKVMKDKLITNLNVSDETADKILKAFKDNLANIRALNKERKKIIESIELDPGAADIDTKLDNMINIESEILKSRKDFFANLRTFMTPQQIAKTIVMKKNFEKELKNQLKKRKNNKNKINDTNGDGN